MGQYKYNNIAVPYNTDYILNSILFNKDVRKYFTDIKNYSRRLQDHSLNVALLSHLVGTGIYDDTKKLYELTIAALLHDYGKIFIAKSILNKPEALTRKKRKIIEQHSTIGYIKLKQSSSFNENILKGILDHHERMNGNGYNFGKTEKEISPYAKIIMIADVYDAMVTDRVYRKHIEPSIVIEYLKSKAGPYFDTYHIELFLKYISNYDLTTMKANVNEKINLAKID